MRYWIFTLLCTISLSASAQWWHVNIHFKKHPVMPLLKPARANTVSRISTKYALSTFKVERFVERPTQFSLEAAEDLAMRTAQHNMRYRIYNVASYNFSDLAELYIKQDRLSEAKWYYLQSNLISRGQNDDKHTIANLMGLAMIKARLGDFVSAELDLVEARYIARSKNMPADLLLVEKESKYIQDNKSTFVKTEVRYAEAATADNNKKAQ